MSRNKYSEQTVEKIISISMKLFIEKGYENTSIQEIINNLGMSKGAIYHHFKSKEEIIIAVLEVSNKTLLFNVSPIIKSDCLTAIEKLRKVMLYCINSKHQIRVTEFIPSFLQSPKFLAMKIASDYIETAPKIFEPLIRSGMEDGTIQTEFPKELSQILLLVFNIWLNPSMFRVSNDELHQKCKFFQSMTESLGVSFFDEEMISIMCEAQKSTR